MTRSSLQLAYILTVKTKTKKKKTTYDLIRTSIMLLYLKLVLINTLFLGNREGHQSCLNGYPHSF